MSWATQVVKRVACYGWQVLIEELSDGLAGSGSQKLNGHGRVVLKNGAVYEGNWVNGCMHGAGKLVFPDGIEYDGDFDNNTMTGTGVSLHQSIRSARSVGPW